MKTKRLMKLLMAAPGISRNQARKIVADARENGISNHDALCVFCEEMADHVMETIGHLIEIIRCDDIEDMMLDDIGDIGDEM